MVLAVLTDANPVIILSRYREKSVSLLVGGEEGPRALTISVGFHVKYTAYF